MKKYLLWILLILIFVGFASLNFLESSIDNYFYLITITSFCYLVFILLLNKITIDIKSVIAIIIGIFILKILAINLLPIGSDDHFRYLWDGKVITNCINPFEYAPNSSELNSLHSDLIPQAVSYNYLKTIYFPISQASFALAYLIGGESIAGLKIILLLTDLLISIGLFLLLKKNNLNYKYSLIYILSPLIFFQFFIDVHIDLLGIMFFLFALVFYKEKKVISALLLGASLAVKPTLLIALPILFFYEHELKKKIIWAVIPILFLTISFIPFAIDTNPFDSLMNFTKHWVFNGAGFNLLGIFLDVNYTIRILLLIIFCLVYILILIFNRNVFSSIYYSMIALFLLSPVLHPWYITWLIIPLIINFRISGVIFISTISFTFYTVLIYQKTGIWQDYNIVLLIEYLPVLALIIYEFYKSLVGIRFFKRLKGF